MTSDIESEFSILVDLVSVDINFAHPYSSHESGTNENFNGLLREFFPKRQSLKPITDEEFTRYVSAINNRPRRLHHYNTATFQFGLAKKLKQWNTKISANLLHMT